MYVPIDHSFSFIFTCTLYTCLLVFLSLSSGIVDKNKIYLGRYSFVSCKLGKTIFSVMRTPSASSPLIFLRLSLLFVSGAIAIMAHEVSEAYQIALESCDELLPEDDFVQRIEKDLKDIRAQFPAVADLHHTRKWEPGVLLLSDVNQATLATINNSPYGPIQSQAIFQDSIYSVRFNKPYNPEVLAKILKRDYGVQHADPNGVVGASSRITLTTDPSEKYTYEFMKGWGDCPSGCIYKHYWTFTTGPGENAVKLVNERGDDLNVSERRTAIF